MNRRLFLLAGLATLSACATRPVLVTAPESSRLEELEPIYGVTSDWRGLTITVATRGCTRKEDFVFFVDRHIGTAGIAFARRRLETCPTPPRPARAAIEFSFSELHLTAGTQIYVLNPVRSAGPVQDQGR